MLSLVTKTIFKALKKMKIKTRQSETFFLSREGEKSHLVMKRAGELEPGLKNDIKRFTGLLSIRKLKLRSLKGEL